MVDDIADPPAVEMNRAAIVETAQIFRSAARHVFVSLNYQCSLVSCEQITESMEANIWRPFDPRPGIWF